jgi:hypothetical protein
MILSMLAAVVLMADTPAAAAAAEAAPPPAAPPVSSRQKLTKQGMVCRNQPVLGSKMPKKVCTTPQEDAERKANDRELADYIQRSTRAPASN